MRRLFQILWATGSRVGPSKIGIIAAGIAFYSLLSVFPAIAAVIALAGLFIEPGAVVAQLETITRLVPAEAAGILVSEASKVAGASSDGLSLAFAIGLCIAIYLSTRATTALIHGLNVACDVIETRGFIRLWATTLLLTTALVFGTAIMFILLVVTPAALAFVPEELLPGSTADAVRTLRWVVLGVLLPFGLSVTYYFGPDQPPGDRRWHWITPGSALAAILWLAGSIGFSLYVTYFADYNASFGSLGGVVILLTWLWLSAYVVLLGALVDTEARITVD
ncbi:MAG: YihY/virulence factor BrkB family protein [Pseudomonadota bacterium]